MKIDIRVLKTGDCFQFIGSRAIHEIRDCLTYQSKETGSVHNTPTMHRMDVVCESWMDGIPHTDNPIVYGDAQ